jgi:flavin-binding protein dodecin
MSDNVYGVTEVVGSSTKSLADAIAQAVETASGTLRNLEWFEVTDMRGHIKDGRVAHYQVMLKLGFRYEKRG